jgi:hypothetical protein
MVVRPEYLVCILALLVLVWDKLCDSGDDCKFVMVIHSAKTAPTPPLLPRRTMKFLQRKIGDPARRAKTERFFSCPFAVAMCG